MPIIIQANGSVFLTRGNFSFTQKLPKAEVNEQLCILE